MRGRKHRSDGEYYNSFIGTHLDHSPLRLCIRGLQGYKRCPCGSNYSNAKLECEAVEVRGFLVRVQHDMQDESSDVHFALPDDFTIFSGVGDSPRNQSSR